MRKDTIVALAKEIEKQFISILIAHELVELKPFQKQYRFKNITLTEKALLQLSNNKKTAIKEIPDTFLVKCLHTFPSGYRSTKKVVRDKLGKYMAEYPEVTETLVLKAFKLHNENNVPPYCGNASNFISKRSPGQVAESRLHSYIESWLDSGADGIDDPEDWGEDID